MADYCHSFFCYKKKLLKYGGFSLFTYRFFFSTIDERPIVSRIEGGNVDD